MTAPNIADIGTSIGRSNTSGPDGVQPWSAPAPANQGLQDPREAAIWSRLRLRHFTAAGNGVDVAVGAGVTSLAVTFVRQEPNTDYGVHVIPAWSTTAYVALADKATTGFTVHFGSASPGGGSTISYSTFRSED